MQSPLLFSAYCGICVLTSCPVPPARYLPHATGQDPALALRELLIEMQRQHEHKQSEGDWVWIGCPGRPGRIKDTVLQESHSIYIREVDLLGRTVIPGRVSYRARAGT